MHAALKGRPRKVFTLCLVHEAPRILLGMKKKGFGKGLWNGFGGKVEKGETIEEAAHRELREEAGIGVMMLREAGVILCDIAGEPFIREVHMFCASGVIGDPTETDEMRPEWFLEDSLPFDDMWQSDRMWFPFFLRNEAFQSVLEFDALHRLVRSDVRSS